MGADAYIHLYEMLNTLQKELSARSIELHSWHLADLQSLLDQLQSLLRYDRMTRDRLSQASQTMIGILFECSAWFIVAHPADQEFFGIFDSFCDALKKAAEAIRTNLKNPARSAL